MILSVELNSENKIQNLRTQNILILVDLNEVLLCHKVHCWLMLTRFYLLIFLNLANFFFLLEYFLNFQKINLIVYLLLYDVEINEVKLSMLLDTGSDKNLLFSFPENDTIEFYNTKNLFQSEERHVICTHQ